MLEIVKGDALKLNVPDERFAIAHVCNDVGAWGAGFTAALDRIDKNAGRMIKGVRYKLGCVTVDRLSGDYSNVVLIHMIAQHGLPSRFNPRPLDMGALAVCLREVNLLACTHKFDVRMPKIGAGLARGDWREIETLLHGIFDDSPACAVVCDYCP